EGRAVRPLPDFAREAGDLVPLYRAMVLTRRFDAKAIALQRTGRIGTYSSALGQEAVGAGLAAAMRADDILVPTYRETAAILMRGVTLEEMLLYWGGDERGADYAGPREDFPVSVPVGTHPLHAVGAAYAFKLRRQERAAVTVFGDGATSKGDVYEALNFAGVWRLPVVFVVINNNWAISMPRAAQTAAETLAQKGRRLGGYFSWNVLEVLLNMSLMPIVLVPICRQMAGRETVGLFVFVLGIVSLVGVTPTKGLNNALLRDLTATEKSRQRLLVRTSLFMAVAAMTVLLLVVLVACGLLSGQGTQSKTTLGWVAILAVAFAARNLQTTGSVDLTVSRGFAQRMIWRSIGSVLALTAIPAYFLLGADGLPLGFAMGHVAALILLLTVRRSLFLERPLFARDMIGPLARSWLILSLVTFFAASGRYIHRTVLGSCHGPDTVMVFFAAAATLEICIMPISTLGLFAFQLLSAHRNRDRFSPRFFAGYVLAAVAAVPCLYFLIRFAAIWPLRWLYAKELDDAIAPLGIMAIGAGLTILMHASRPFVQKFSSLRALGVIGIVSFAAHLGAALVLIPGQGITGAAWSYTIGQAVTSLAWFGFLLVGFLGLRSTQDKSPGRSVSVNVNDRAS
ncbi:MAG: hypothetical protein IH987_06920, partial [Planctomycetes bacterium]|nr:hypothetical protein [Planctomycetota bacterium]